MRFNDLRTPNAFQNHWLSGFTLRIGFWIPLLFILTGCSSGPSENDLLEALEETAPHGLVCSSRVVEITEIKSLKEGQKWKVKFESQDKPAEPWLLPVDVPTELKKNAPDQESFQTAVEQFQQLRFPEKNKIQELHKELRAFRFPKVYREKYGVSDEVLWRGEGTLEKEGELYHLELTKVKSNEDLDFKRLTTKSKLPKQTAVADGSQNDPLLMYQEQQRNFVDAVKSSWQKMEARLAAEKTNLETLVTHPVRLQGIFKNGTAKSINLNFEFEQNRDKHSLCAVAIDSDEIISRVVFSGSFLLPDVSERNSFASRNVHDGWVLTLKNEDFNLSELAKTFPRGMVIYYDQPTAKFRLANRNSAFDFITERETRPEINSTQLLKARILKGAQFNGKEQINSMPDRLLQMTNMEFDPARNLFRVVIQEKDNPFISAVFEGVRRTDPPHHLGIPIQLKQVSFSHLLPSGNKTRTNLFSKHSGILLLVPTKAGWQGVIGDSKLTFQLEKNRLTLQSALERWKLALQPGTQWSGPLYWKNDPEETLRMRVADYRPEQNYVRLVLEKKSDARQYVVYEGSLHKESGAIDGFSLVMQQRGQSSFVDKISDGVFFNQYVYSGGRVWNIDWDHKLFRLSPDGKQMYAYSLRGQRTILTKDEAVKPSHQLKAAEFQKLWRSALSTTILWKGVLTAPKTNSSVEILAKIRSYESTTNTVELVLEVKGNSKIKANYEGTLVTTENMINGYALNLKKITGVNSTSHFFDSYNLGSRKVQFRLNETGTKMYGRLTDFQYDDPEFIELEASTGK